MFNPVRHCPYCHRKVRYVEPVIGQPGHTALDHFKPYWRHIGFTCGKEVNLPVDQPRGEGSNAFDLR